MKKGMELAGIIKRKYNLIGIGKKLSKIMINKRYQREIWSKNNIPCPNWKVFNEKDVDIKKITSTFSYPFIIKPTESAGSRGVSVIKKFNQIKTALDTAFKASHNKEIIVEKFLLEMSTVESMTFEGKTEILAVTEKLKVEGTNNTVANSLESINRNSETFKDLSALTKNALKTLEYNNGPAHTEILYNKKNQ